MTIKRIFSIEFIKTLRQGNYILFSLILLVYTAIFFITLYYSHVNQVPMKSMIDRLFSVDESFGGLFLVIFIIMNIGKEYSDSTIAKNIIDGYTRDWFYTGKLLLLLASTLFMFIIGKIFLLIGEISLGHWSELLSYLTPPILINSFLGLLSKAIWGFFLVFLTKNIAISIIVFYIWSVIENIISFVGHLDSVNIPFENYLPLSSMHTALHASEIQQISSIIIAVFYLFLMLFVPYYLLLKRDITN